MVMLFSLIRQSRSWGALLPDKNYSGALLSCVIYRNSYGMMTLLKKILGTPQFFAFRVSHRIKSDFRIFTPIYLISAPTNEYLNTHKPTRNPSESPYQTFEPITT